MSANLSLQAEKREVTGKKVGKLRRDGQVPAVVFERGKDSENISIAEVPLGKMWQEAGKNHVVSLSYGDKKRLVMFKDVSFDPAKGRVSHVAFHAIKQNEAVEAEIPVEIVGEIPAEKMGYFLVHPLDVINVKALPGDLPEKFELSGETLVEVGDMLKVSDIKVSDKIEILIEADRPIAIVEESRANVEAEAEEAEVTDAADVPSAHGGEEKSE